NNNKETQKLEHGMSSLCELLTQLRDEERGLYIIGNGGSAGVAAHAVTDFFNATKIRATTLHESSLLTCMANDYGYENAFARMLSQMVQPHDVVITISSSGQSMNIRNAAQQVIQNEGIVITLSGFDSDNPLRSMGNLNFWLDSHDYGMVEIGHQFLLHNIADRIRLGVFE
ncbi:MAG: SIS domain-containing protein, partial [Proteobacteria bacterium]|nr:SIS domain-containing protein [Pseudomonadota bacterium]